MLPRRKVSMNLLSSDPDDMPALIDYDPLWSLPDLENIPPSIHSSGRTLLRIDPLLQVSDQPFNCFDGFDGRMGGGQNPTPLCCPKCKEMRPFYCLPSESSPCKVCKAQLGPTAASTTRIET